MENASQECLEHYFGLFEEILEHPDMEAENIYNIDKTAVMLSIQSEDCYIIYKTVKTQIQKSLQNRESATVIECISATGVMLAPVVILGVKMHPNEWYPESNGEPGQWHNITCQNSYTNNKLSLSWLKTCSTPQTAQKAEGKWRLLICDAHGSHETADFLTFCFFHKIFDLRLSAHMSHLTQPLDVGCFSPLKQNYYQQVKEASDEGIKKIIKRLFIELYKKAPDKAFTVQNIHKAWKHAGLFPLNSECVIARACPRPLTPPAQLSTGTHNIPTIPQTPHLVLDVC
jgi:hypothetical protein